MRPPRVHTLLRTPVRLPADRAARGYVGVVRTCDFCGRQAEDAETMTWIVSVENGRRKTYCDTCSREHLRAIESKLDAEWW
jgi:hypothetical protein